jgi:cell division septal protein FtsQ
MAKRITKKAKKIYDAKAWAVALKEGRVVRYNDGMTMQSHPTVAGALARVAEIQAQGLAAEIVRVAYA